MAEVSSDKDVLGRSPIFTEEVINDIHVKSESGAIGCAGSRCSSRSRIGTS